MVSTDNRNASSLRERKKAATRSALRRAAVDLVAERGYQAVTVEDIAAAADVSARTYFNYFPSKEDAIVGWDPLQVSEMCGLLLDRPSHEAPLSALRHVLTDVYHRADIDHTDLLKRMAVIRADPHLLAHHVARWAEAERGLAAAVARRRGTDPARDRYASLVVAVALSAGRVAVMAWCDQGGRVPLVGLVAACLDDLASGLTEPEGGSGACAGVAPPSAPARTA